MPSTHTPLGVELMVTGENAGTWGTKTNTNLQLIEQLAAGYQVQTLNAGGTGANTTELTVSDGATGATLATRVIILGSEAGQAITGNKIVTIPIDVETWYFVKNSTTGSFTVQFKYASGSGDSFTWTAAQKDWRVLVATANDGTNPDITEVSLTTAPAGSDTQIQYNNSGAFGGDANLYWDSTGLNIGTSKEIRLQDDASGQYIGQKAANSTTSYTLTWPQTAAGANDYVLTSQTDGTLAWVENSGGTSWNAVITAAPSNAVAGKGYPCNTTGGAFTVTLPTSATLGDEIAFVDYAGTFDTNNLTVGRNSHKIQGSAADLTVATERAAFTLVYVDATQGWLLKNNQEFNEYL